MNKRYEPVTVTLDKHKKFLFVYAALFLIFLGVALTKGFSAYYFVGIIVFAFLCAVPIYLILLKIKVLKVG